MSDFLCEFGHVFNLTNPECLICGTSKICMEDTVMRVGQNAANFTLPCLECREVRDGVVYNSDDCSYCGGSGRCDGLTTKQWMGKGDPLLSQGHLAGQVLCATGKMVAYTRNTFEVDVKRHGGLVSPNVSRLTTVLVRGSSGGISVKVRDAREKGIAIINESEYESLKTGKVGLIK